MTPNLVPIRITRLHSLVTSALTTHGLYHDAASVIADVVCAAERDGCPSHGLFRVPGYVHALTSGGVQGTLEPRVDTDAAPGLVMVDCRGGFAAPAFAAAVPALVEKARAQGVAALALRRARHFSALWWEAETLAGEHGLVTLAFVNTAAFVAYPGVGDGESSCGGAERVFGTNPMAFAWPRGAGRPPLVWDQASSAMARGEMQLLRAAGRPLPDEGCGVGPDGRPTTDPAVALGAGGAQLPFGGHKGGNLALMVELLAAGLTHSPFAHDAARELDAASADAAAAGGGLPPGDTPTENGELILCLDPARFKLPGDLRNGDGRKSEAPPLRTAEKDWDSDGGGGSVPSPPLIGGPAKTSTEAAPAAVAHAERYLARLTAKASNKAHTYSSSSSSSSSTPEPQPEAAPGPPRRLPGDRRRAHRHGCEARGGVVEVDRGLLAAVTRSACRK